MLCLFHLLSASLWQFITLNDQKSLKKIPLNLLILAIYRHFQIFKHSEQRVIISLSKYIWNLKEDNINNWSVIKLVPIYFNGSRSMLFREVNHALGVWTRDWNWLTLAVTLNKYLLRNFLLSTDELYFLQKYFT